jgi:hypothetical protein
VYTQVSAGLRGGNQGNLSEAKRHTAGNPELTLKGSVVFFVAQGDSARDTALRPLGQ